VFEKHKEPGAGKILGCRMNAAFRSQPERRIHAAGGNLDISDDRIGQNGHRVAAL
jgi:hypothetical protein